MSPTFGYVLFLFYDKELVSLIAIPLKDKLLFIGEMNVEIAL